MVDLLLDLTGLCGIVPNKVITDPANRARILLVEAGEPPAGGGHVHVGPPHEPHISVLVCNEGSVDASSPRKPDLFFQRGAILKAVFFLQDQDVSLNTTGTALSFDSDAGAGSGCHTTTNWQKINWLASIAGISPGSDAVRSECFNTPAQGVHASVAARVALLHGTLRTSALAKDGSDAVLKWDFRATGHPDVGLQALTEAVQLQAPLAAASCEITTSLLRRARSERIREIFPGGVGQSAIIRLKATAGQVFAGIANVPFADLVRLREPLPTGHRDPDAHFEHFYALSEPTTLGPKRIPHPRLGDPRCPASGPPSLRTPQCPPALFAPSASA